MKRAICSNVRDPENRSKKRCVCGGHGDQARKRKRQAQAAFASREAVVTADGRYVISRTRATP